ncbi:MAG: ADP-ribosylglycohydrolase family protein [Deltaproteobacteria bacterium]|nr:ADP-ribosylglycohydrolase family protein [Deltaproteobacteria bacterium]
MTKQDDPFEDRFVGACLGLMAGDALGQPVEGWPWPQIEAHYGWLEKMVAGRFPVGGYTDDTQMAIGLLESLVEARGFDPGLCAARWLANYEPQRGYGGRIHLLMTRLAQGDNWDEVGTDSFGNGSAMRIGPLGVWFAANEEELKEAALTSARITHRHPQALAGALVQALAVARACRLGLAGQALELDRFIPPLARQAAPIDPATGQRLEDLFGLRPAPLPELRDRLSRLFACDVRAIEAVPPALAAVLLTKSFSQAVCLAVNLGGDTDTLGALAGALAGAYYGASAIPGDWWQALENRPGSGRDYLVGLCRRAMGLVQRPA